MAFCKAVAASGNSKDDKLLDEIHRPVLPVARSSRSLRSFKLFALIAAAVTLSACLSFWQTHSLSQSIPPVLTGSEWLDNVWPLREQTPWDISTDYPFPRRLEYDVTEGTWLRLDVHPHTGDIIFDMLGDLYCLPADAYTPARLSSGSATKAHPVLLGVPHDSDPHFSPDGDRIVYRSDAELGVENIWITEWTGCKEMDVRPEIANKVLSDALSVKDEEELLLASGVKETPKRKERRLVREGRLSARRVTNETYRWVSDARLHPSGSKVIATKWYTSSRSLGAGEGWEYDVPNIHSTDIKIIEAGSGQRLVGRTLPFGWTPEQYGDQQIGPEQFIWRGNDTVIYAINVKDSAGQYNYAKDVHAGIYAIKSTNLTSQQTSTLVDSLPGGASRPELSRDGRTLAFVRRVRDKEALVLKDLESGTTRNIWHGLTYDLTSVSAPMGTYPSFSFTPNDAAIIIWAAGQIHYVPLSTNAIGEKVAAGDPTPIRFRARIEKRIAETVTAHANVLETETQNTQRVYAFSELRVDESGDKVVFQGAGATYVQSVGKYAGQAKQVPVLHPDAPYYSPSFVHGAEDLVIHTRWSDTDFTAFELSNVTSGVVYELVGLPLGRYYLPVFCECSGRERTLAFVKIGGDYLSGDIVATAGAGLYLGDVTLPSDLSDRVAIENIRYIPSELQMQDLSKTKIQFLEKNSKLLVQQSTRAFVIDLAAGPNDLGEYGHETLAKGRMSSELIANPQASNAYGERLVAFVDFFHVYIAPAVNASEPVWTKPGHTVKGLARLSRDGGHDIIWSGNGKKLFWFLGPYLHMIEVADIGACAANIRMDHFHFGISCTQNLPYYQEVVVEYSSDIARLKDEAIVSSNIGVNDTMAVANADFFVVTNATLLTMETGDALSDVLHDAILVSRGGKIEAIVGAHDAVIPYGATVLNAEGGLVVPGYIDVHAHWNGFSTVIPARSWEHETFLAYGVTTLHNPSADNVQGFAERFRLERGQMVGPRIFQVGDVIYGAGIPGIHQDIIDMDEAFSALIRIKAEGGPSSFSYKNYNLPSRASRQRLLLAARTLNMLCVPEGGMNYDWDQTYIVDGMTTVEHALPVPELFDDVITLYALSGTGSTPTHVVNYGGAWGEQLVWAMEDIPNDAKLRRFTRHDVLAGITESTSRPQNSYALFNTSASTAKMMRKGLRAHIGAHGEPPLGLNYHAEMYFARQGGLSNYEVIRAATSDAAATLGIHQSLGTLVPGKLADFLIYPPGVDLLNGDITATRNIRYVVRGGRVWDAETMTEVWPVKGRKAPMPPINAE